MRETAIEHHQRVKVKEVLTQRHSSLRKPAFNRGRNILDHIFWNLDGSSLEGYSTDEVATFVEEIRLY